MALTLTDTDLADLTRLLRDFRHAEATALIAFLRPKMAAARVSSITGAAQPHAPPPPFDKQESEWLALESVILSGQMTDADLHDRLRSDTGFAAWMATRTSGRLASKSTMIVR